MSRTRVFCAAALFAALLILGTLPAAAECTTPDCRLSPAQSRQVNPDPGLAEVNDVDLPPPGSLQPISVGPPHLGPRMGMPLFSAVREAARTVDRPSSTVGSPAVPGPPSFPTLDVRQRYQSPDDLSCGVQALGMAMDALDGSGPASSALLAFLEEHGMLYDFGTGAEELAFAAGSFGYPGSVPFHGGTLADLTAELQAGRAVVVALGTGDPDVPGHFVTVTGISPDGEWIAYRDPVLGEQVVPTADFLALWERQGRSGVLVRKAASGSPEGDVMPWVALAAGLMAVVSTTPLARRRMGIGGALEAPYGGANPAAPPGPAPPGMKWESYEVDVYGWRDVEVDQWVEVPVTERQQVQVGVHRWTEEVPAYKTVKIDKGHWENRPVTKYKTETYISGYTQQQKLVPTPAGWETITLSVPVYASHQVAYTTSENVWVSNWVDVQVPAGHYVVEHEEPVYEWQDVQVGTKLMPTLTSERQWVKIGTEVEWELVEDPDWQPLLVSQGGETYSDLNTSLWGTCDSPLGSCLYGLTEKQSYTMSGPEKLFTSAYFNLSQGALGEPIPGITQTTVRYQAAVNVQVFEEGTMISVNEIYEVSKVAGSFVPTILVMESRSGERLPLIPLGKLEGEGSKLSGTYFIPGAQDEPVAFSIRVLVKMDEWPPIIGTSPIHEYQVFPE